MKLRKKMFISYAILDIYNEYVAPRAGAWIETHGANTTSITGNRSPLAQGRGLKLTARAGGIMHPGSPLAQGRGLKPNTSLSISGVTSSPLAQGRGLKHA